MMYLVEIGQTQLGMKELLTCFTYAVLEQKITFRLWLFRLLMQTLLVKQKTGSELKTYIR